MTVEDIDDKNYLITHSHFLRRQVFIAQDRTKFKRIKHKTAVDELIIRNGVVMKQQPRLPTSSANQNSDQSSCDDSSVVVLQ